MTKAKLYSIRNIITSEEYIGVTTQSLQRRWNQHISRLRRGKHTYKIQEAFNKYGEENFVISIVKEGELDDILKMELELTTITHVNGYNIIIGGGGVEERKRASQIMVNKFKNDAEFKRKVSEKIIAKNTGRKISEETKRKMSLAKCGLKWSDENKQKRSLQYSGINNPNAGNYKLYLNVDNGIYYTTPELFTQLGVNRSGYSWLKRINSPRLNNFIKV